MALIRTVLFLILVCFFVVQETLAAARPKPPRFTLDSTTPTSVTVYITHPPGITGIKAYKVQYQEIGSKKVQITIDPITEYTIDGLKPSTAYRARIFTKGSTGNSKFGPWVNVVTMSDGPPPTTAPPPPLIPEAPQFLAAEPAATSALTTWKTPPDNGVQITGYKLTYGTSDNPTANTIDLHASQTETQLEGLADNTQFHMSLVAYSADGESEPIRIGFRTLEEKYPPPAIESLHSISKETAIELTWTIPETTSADAIDSITVRFGTEGTPMDELVVSHYSSNVVSFGEDNLLSGTRYVVSVVTVNEQGQSEPVMVMIETLAPVPVPTTEPTTPPPPPTTPVPTEPELLLIPNTPENLRATSITAIAARLMWEKPMDNGADIVGYALSFGPIYNPTANTLTLNPSPTSYDLYGLQKNVQYSVYVTAYNRNGQSLPAEIEFWTSSGLRAPPPVEEVESYPQQTSIYFIWTLPKTSETDGIDTVRFGIGPYATHIDRLSMVNLEKDTQTYTAERLIPGARYTVAILTQNAAGDSEPVTLTVETDHAVSVPTRPPRPDKGYTGRTPPPPVELRATVLTPTTIKVDFVDPTLQGRNEVYDERYYTLRYKKEDDYNYQYMNVRDTPYTLEYLTPRATYEIEVKTVINRYTQSPFTEKAFVFTGENMIRDVTAVQMVVTGPGLVKAVLNWIPPQSEARQITGYVIEYTEGFYVTSRSEFEIVEVYGDAPKATLEDLAGDSVYHVRVAPKFGSGIGRFSDPPAAFATPSVPVTGQPLHCDETANIAEPKEHIVERVKWMGDRSGTIGIPLPYCDDYYGLHECHGSVCFCIPGKAPHGTKTCNPSGSNGSNGPPGVRPQQDDPNLRAPGVPCYVEYDAARRAIDEASKTGKPLVEVRLPYCSSDGFYQPKQCLGSMCYCSTKEGKHTGKEGPIWEADRLDCCKVINPVVPLQLFCSLLSQVVSELRLKDSSKEAVEVVHIRVSVNLKALTN